VAKILATRVPDVITDEWDLDDDDTDSENVGTYFPFDKSQTISLNSIVNCYFDFRKKVWPRV